MYGPVQVCRFVHVSHTAPRYDVSNLQIHVCRVRRLKLTDCLPFCRSCLVGPSVRRLELTDCLPFCRRCPVGPSVRRLKLTDCLRFCRFDLCSAPPHQVYTLSSFLYIWRVLQPILMDCFVRRLELTHCLRFCKSDLCPASPHQRKLPGEAPRGVSQGRFPGPSGEVPMGGWQGRPPQEIPERIFQGDLTEDPHGKQGVQGSRDPKGNPRAPGGMLR